MKFIGVLALFLFSSLLFSTPLFAADVDLLWQAKTYVPPFYEGKALWTNQSDIVFTAVPTGFSNPSALIYRWSKDGVVLGSNSGVNRRSLAISDGILSLSTQIKVDVFGSSSADPLASATVTLRPTYVRPLVYEDNPLYGLMLNNAIEKSFTMTDPEVSFAALPVFGQATLRTAPAYSYTWSTNSADIKSGNKVTYRAPANEPGSSSVTLKTVNSRVLMPYEEKGFTINFGDQSQPFQ